MILHTEVDAHKERGRQEHNSGRNVRDNRLAYNPTKKRFGSATSKLSKYFPTASAVFSTDAASWAAHFCTFELSASAEFVRPLLLAVVQLSGTCRGAVLATDLHVQ